MAEKEPDNDKTSSDEHESENSTNISEFKNEEVDENKSEMETTVYQKLRSLTLGRRYKSKSLDGGWDRHNTLTGTSKEQKKRGRWNLKFNYKLRNGVGENSELPESSSNGSCSCVCTGYRRTEEHHLGAGVVFDSSSSSFSTSSSSASSSSSNLDGKCERKKSFRKQSRHANGNNNNTNDNKKSPISREPIIDFSKFNPDRYPTEDCDEKARAQRLWEMEEGVDPPPWYQPSSAGRNEEGNNQGQLLALNRFLAQSSPFSHNPMASIFHRTARDGEDPSSIQVVVQQQQPQIQQQQQIKMSVASNELTPIVHSQVDYIHCLVPDLLEISNCGFYWGKIDRYEAERLLENKQEGTFLLRDSAQEDYLFSVSFRRYNRSLHARIEQWNHRFSFDSHDPGVFSSDTVCGLIEHYKDPSCCMFFEPMLTIPLYRTFTFHLQHLCRSVICKMLTYDDINHLELPKTLKAYLKEYHYKQRVRVLRLDAEQ